MSLYKTISFAVCAGLLVAVLGGCEREGPAERAGKELDKTMIDPSKAEGPAERAGKQIDEAAKAAGEAIEEAGEKAKEATK
jgi:hypothetical protein